MMPGYRSQGGVAADRYGPLEVSSGKKSGDRPGSGGDGSDKREGSFYSRFSLTLFTEEEVLKDRKRSRLHKIKRRNNTNQKNPRSHRNKHQNNSASKSANHRKYTVDKRDSRDITQIGARLGTDYHVPITLALRKNPTDLDAALSLNNHENHPHDTNRHLELLTNILGRGSVRMPSSFFSTTTATAPAATLAPGLSSSSSCCPVILDDNYVQQFDWVDAVFDKNAAAGAGGEEGYIMEDADIFVSNMTSGQGGEKFDRRENWSC
ncbi:hypothetical protein WAI453_004393 [Rhynchosporium graminicola]